MRLGIRISRWMVEPATIFGPFAIVITSRVGPRMPDLHRTAALTPWVTLGNRHIKSTLGNRLAMIEPVMCLELDPSRSEIIQGGRRDKVAPRQQFRANQPRTGRQ